MAPARGIVRLVDERMPLRRIDAGSLGEQRDVDAPFRGSRSGRPIMVVLDLLGRRGCLRVLWELREQPLNFRALQLAAETNPSLLNTRLKELREAGWIDHEAGGYRLSDEGRGLLAALWPLYEWAERR